MHIKSKGWALFHVPSNLPVHAGEIYSTHQGEMVEVTGGQPPHKCNSTGRINVDFPDGTSNSYFPGVCQLEWRKL